ncbi:MAG: T9SS type A sorting domain-containing protein [Calditrichaeota bacterium]|nr:T9SS type A sorting domain-containing protein [Calditrichota bacterium]
MKRSQQVILLIFTWFSIIFAQAPIAWIQTYDEDSDSENFKDIYATFNGDYIMCGRSEDRYWIVRIDSDGNQIWSETFEGTGLNSIIETDDGDFLAGGWNTDSRFSAILVNSEGEEIWSNEYADGSCKAVIELKSGEFLLAGASSGEIWRGHLVMINGEGEVIWDGTYGERHFQQFVSMRETEGGVVLGGKADRADRNGREFWVVKVNFEGEIIWENYYRIAPNSIGCSIVSCPDNGFIFGGWAMDRWEGANNAYWCFAIVKINNNGAQQWQRDYHNINSHELLECITLIDEDEYIMVGEDIGGINPLALRIRRDGQVRWREAYDIGQGDIFGARGHFFNSVTVDQDNSILAAGRVNLSFGEESDTDGLVVKLLPEILHPIIMHWSPEDTVFSVLPEDTVRFTVRAIDQQGQELGYEWLFDDSTFAGGDTTVLVQFPDTLGEHTVTCVLSDEEFSTYINWNVSVVEWYIADYQPDSTDILIRRGTSIDFTHQIKSVEELDFNYSWEHFGRGGNFEFEGEDSIRYNFDMTGDHIIRAFISNNDVLESIEWDVDVRSIIWWWWPHENVLSARDDTTIVFEVFPFNEESDSLEYSWFINDEALDCDTSLIEISLPEIGQYEIIAYVQEGVQADTIHWTVDVLEGSFTANDADLADLPTSPMLYPPSPNPFNSTVKLSIYMPKIDHVSLSIFDINGREVSRLVDGDVEAGNQTFVWNAGGFPAGVYVVRMVAGGSSEMRKLVLVR